MKVHKISGYISVLYLIEYDHGLLLLDGGCRPDVKTVLNFIKENLNRPESDLKLVCVTHAHPDHSGGASFYKKRGIKVVGTQACNQWYRGLSGFFTYLTDIFLTYVVAAKVRKENVYQNVLFSRKVNFDEYLIAGQTLPGFPDWQVIEAPGHTDNDISFYHPSTNTAYIGDNIIAIHNKFMAPYPIVLPVHYKNSLGLYIKLGIKNFLMAHYGAHQVPHSEIEKIISKVSDEPRRHKTALPALLLKLFSSK
jgi:glyoxylase-like metal-dependent hydrolase (beta-lactamase superfamily II)